MTLKLEIRSPQTNVAAHGKTGRRRNATELRSADGRVARLHTILLHTVLYCPGITVTGSALAITGP